MTPFINPADLKSFRLEATLVNSASQVAFERDGAGKIEVEVLELDENRLIVEGSDKLCALNHHVLVTLKSLEHRVDLSATARVAEIEPSAPQRVRITLTLLQYDKPGWKVLRQLLADRQEKMDEFLGRAKGC